jgi:hypothetical protein
MFQFRATPRTKCRKRFPRHLLDRLVTAALSALILFITLFSWTCQLDARPSDQPNIVFILADDK